MDLDDYEDEIRELVGLGPKEREKEAGEAAGTRDNKEVAAVTSAGGSNLMRMSKLYQTVRTARLHLLAATSLRDGASRPMRGIGSLEPEDDKRGEDVQTSSRYSDKVNCTTTFGLDNMVCDTCNGAHKIVHKYGTRIKPEDMGPLCFILSDQHFPACLRPVDKGECLKILRVEDASLELLVKKFVNSVRGQVIPAGTVVLVCSLSHLQAVGLEAYCADVARVTNLIWQKFKSDVTTLHGLPIVNVELTDKILINNMVNCHRWYVSVLPKRARYIHNAATVLYKNYLQEGWEGDKSEGERRRLPRGLQPNAAGAVYSTCSLCTTTDTVKRTDIKTEMDVIVCMVKELNDQFNLGLATNLRFARGSARGASVPRVREGGSDICVVVGASHADRTASVLEREGLTVINLARPGWKISEESVKAKISELRRELDRSPSTACIIFMCFDNNVYFGASQIGTRRTAFKDQQGKYHIEGKLAMARKEDIRELVHEIIPLVKETATLQKVFVTPLPRYVSGGCCENELHVTNVGAESHVTNVLDTLADYKKWLRDILHKTRVTGVRTALAGDLAGISVGGLECERTKTCWEADNVHLDSSGYDRLGKELAHIVRSLLKEPGAAPTTARRHQAELGAFYGSGYKRRLTSE